MAARPSSKWGFRIFWRPSLRIAATVLGETTRRQLETIENIDELERAVVARLRPANDDET